MLDPTIDRLIDTVFTEYEQRALAGFNNVQAVAKSDGSAVTQVDLETNASISEAFKATTPDYGIVSEEDPIPFKPEAAWRWVMDPVDGTASFARGYPTWGLGIGLTHQGEPTAGFLNFPALGERYVTDGKTILRNGAPARLQEPASLRDLRNVLVGSTSHRELPLSHLEHYKLRNFGSSLYHLLCLGMGRAELMIADLCKVWDLAPGLPFTRARGYVERYIDGSPFSHAELMAAQATGYSLPQPLLIGREDIVEEALALLR